MDEAIEPDIWLRLARLDTRCELRVFSMGGPERRRVWIAEVRHRHDSLDREPLRINAATMREALLKAVTLAEAKGWPNGEQRVSGSPGRYAEGERGGESGLRREGDD